MAEKINILSQKQSIFNQFIAEVRSELIQRDSLRFRRNLERMGEIIAYEISQKLKYEENDIETPLGIARVPVLCEKPVLATVLRAGIPLHQGLLNIFDTAENAFIAAYRKYHKDGSFDIKFEYCSSPVINDKVLILSDAMMATGSSIELAYNAMIERGKPRHTHIVSVIASNEAIEYIIKHLPEDKITLWLGAVDNELTAKGYIVPGLGDAGDLAYGGKNTGMDDDDDD